jgi:hypothetical protein
VTRTQKERRTCYAWRTYLRETKTLQQPVYARDEPWHWAHLQNTLEKIASDSAKLPPPLSLAP